MKNAKKIKKKYFLSVIEEMILNPQFAHFRGGRIEVYNDFSPYSIYEARFLIPEELFENFRETFDFKEVDALPYINFDCPDTILKHIKLKEKRK